MLQNLIDRSQDLKHLQDDGYALEIVGAYALIKNVPYVNSQREIKHGTFISELSFVGDSLTVPNTHVIYFAGEFPCNNDGTIITSIQHASNRMELLPGVFIDHSFSNKPEAGYKDYYEKFTNYMRIVIGPAQSLDKSVTAIVQEKTTILDESVFAYPDTNSSRGQFSAISNLLSFQKIAVIGLGGTGAYVLDLIAKTPVSAIHLFDGDLFENHNAFRSPGAASIEDINSQMYKVDYFKNLYSNMHLNIISHSCYINVENLHELEGFDFVFLSIDNGSAKRLIVNELVSRNTPFIDLGIGVQRCEHQLIGHVRVTAITPQKSDHIESRIDFSDDTDDVYSTNIQIADLNALNAVLAVIKWKKTIGFYQDLNREHNSVYSINDGVLQNDEYVIPT